MSDIVNGKNVIVYIYDGGVWKLYACARSCTLNLTTDMIETSVSGHGYFATYVPTKHSFTGTLEGVVSLESGSILNFPDLQQRQLSLTLLLMRFQRTSDNGQVYTSEVQFYISNSVDVGSFDDVNVFTIELRGTGVITQIFTPQPPSGDVIVRRYEFTGTEGQTTVTDATLVGKDILEVNTDGIGNSKIILTGTPVNKEVKYTSGTGSFEFAIPMTDGEEGFILYQDI